jgi:hypothetical protein
MPEKTVKRRLQDCDAALASDDGRILFLAGLPLLAAEETRRPRGKQRLGRRPRPERPTWAAPALGAVAFWSQVIAAGTLTPIGVMPMIPG